MGVAVGVPPTFAAGFLPVADLVIGEALTDVAIADADGDGFDEVAVALPLSRAVGLSWNRADAAPSFEPSLSIAMGVAVAQFVFQDLSGDGLADLAAVNKGRAGRLSVRLAQPGRGFGPRSLHGLPDGDTDGARHALALDADRDGDVDLVVVEALSITVFRNDGAGSFAAGESTPGPDVRVVGATAGRLDGAPGDDLLLFRDDGFQAWLNDGAARFFARPVTAASWPAVAVDLDGDGPLDVVSLAAATSYRNDGTGLFIVGGAVAVPAGAVTAVPKDLNGDDVVDLLVGSDLGTMSVMYGDGAGSFEAPHVRPAPDSPRWLFLGDINGDGDAGDPAWAGVFGSVGLAVSAGVASLSPTGPYPVFDQPIALAFGDLDVDGDLDWVSADAGGGGLSRYDGLGDGTFVSAGFLDTGGRPVDVAIADLDGDGWSDLLAAVAGDPSDPESRAEVVQFHNSGGSFDPPLSLSVGQGPSSLASGDLDGDGREDAVLADRSARRLVMLRSNGAVLELDASIDLGLAPADVVLADLDGDGDLDIATTGVGSDAGGIALLRNESTPGVIRMVPIDTLSAGMGPASLVAIDLDLDARVDLAVLDVDRGEVVLFRNADGMAFDSPSTIAVGTGATALGTGHVNCDAVPDLLVTIAEPSELHVRLGEGGLRFTPPQRFSTGAGPSSVVAADFDGVGADDLVVAAADDDAIEVHKNGACAVGAACTAAGLDVAAPAMACAGTPVRLTASSGFAAYFWQGGGRGARLTVPAVLPGELSYQLRALDANGCEARASARVVVSEATDVAIEAASVRACAAPEELVTFALQAASPRSDDGLSFIWDVEAPGRVASSGPSCTVEFPLETLAGSYFATVTALDQAGCTSQATVELSLVEGGPPIDPGNRLMLLSDDSGRIALRWDGAQSGLHDVLRTDVRGPIPRTATVAGAVEGPTWSDAPEGASTWFYRVVARSDCEPPATAR